MSNDERIIDLLTKQERHQRYFSNALTAFILIQVATLVTGAAFYFTYYFPYK